MSSSINQLIENIENASAVAPVAPAPKRKIGGLKKSKPVEPVVQIEPEVLDEIVPETALVLPEVLDDIESDITVPTHHIPEEVAPESEGANYHELYTALLVKYNALFAQKSSVSRKATSEPAYTSVLMGKNGSYKGSLLAKTKTDTDKVLGPLFGVNVIKGRTEKVIRYEFCIEKYDKKDMLPMIVKDKKTGMCYKNQGGAIEMTGTEGVQRVYLMKDIESV